MHGRISADKRDCQFSGCWPSQNCFIRDTARGRVGWVEVSWCSTPPIECEISSQMRRKTSRRHLAAIPTKNKLFLVVLKANLSQSKSAIALDNSNLQSAKYPIWKALQKLYKGYMGLDHKKLHICFIPVSFDKAFNPHLVSSCPISKQI